MLRVKFHSEDLAGNLQKVDPNEIGILDIFPLQGGMCTSSSLCTLQSRHNDWWVGDTRSY